MATGAGYEGALLTRLHDQELDADSAKIFPLKPAV